MIKLDTAYFLLQRRRARRSSIVAYFLLQRRPGPGGDAAAPELDGPLAEVAEPFEIVVGADVVGVDDWGVFTGPRTTLLPETVPSPIAWAVPHDELPPPSAPGWFQPGRRSAKADTFGPSANAIDDAAQTTALQIQVNIDLDTRGMVRFSV